MKADSVRGVVDVSVEWFGFTAALLALAGPAAFFMGRLQGDVVNLRRDLESLKTKTDKLHLDYGLLAATVVTREVPRQQTREATDE